MMPKRSFRSSAFLMRSLATDISGYSRVSVVELVHRLDYALLLRLGQLRVHRQGQHLVHGRLGFRQSPRPVPQVRKAGLEVQAKRVVHRTSDAAGLQVGSEGVPLCRPDGVLVENVLVGGVDGGRCDMRVALKARVVPERLLPARGAPGGQEWQLGQEHGRLQRVESAVGTDFVVMVLLAAAVGTEASNTI